MSCRGRFPRLVERAFLGELSSRQRRALVAHLVTCDACRRSYDRLAAVDRQLGGGSPLARTAIDAIGVAVIDQASRGPRRRLVWAGVGTLAAAAAVVLLALWPREEAFRPRGGGTTERTPGVRLFCVAADSAGARVVADGRVTSSTQPGPAIRCTIDHELQLAFTTPDREGLTMVAFARHRESILRYAPRPGVVDAVALASDRVDEPLDWSTRLGVNHTPGHYDVVVRFFDRPVTVEAAIGGTVRPLVELRGTLEVTP